MRQIVLSLCDRTGIMLRPWAQHDTFRCIAVDICHKDGYEERDGIEWVGADVMDYLPPLGEYALVAAFPPCTDLAISGRRWFRDKGLGKLAYGLTLVDRCLKICEWTGAPYMIENPVSTLSTYWRKPDYLFDPCDYGGFLEPPGDKFTKRTCLWVGNGFVIPVPKPVYPEEGSKMHHLPNTPDRADIRSETPRGFAQAVYQANYERWRRMAA